MGKALEKIRKSEYWMTGLCIAAIGLLGFLALSCFFFLGNPEAAPAILGEGAPGFLFELGQALGDVLPMNRVVLAIGIVLIGGITGLDGYGFSGVALVAALAACAYLDA